MAQKNKMSALEAFLFAPVNSVTRERLFFNRLYFDLKLAAARRGYALSLFEPDVDRDKFDIVLDDGDNERRIQLKTLLVGASTSTWPTNKRFLRPDIFDGSRLGIVPADCGLGGGVIVIEIEATDDSAPVSYLYSDYFIACMLDMRMILESASAAQTNKKPGRPPQTRKTYAKTLLTELESGGPTDAISLRRQLFVRGKSTDALLALIGLHNT
ncbi:MAG: hypothetical protein GY798_32310, partial [Hyphomicrobiales bacterium]|nr:hypothetical protein [Hyphomicrobiales bacterium]